MVVVRIELWPHGDHNKSKTLGVIAISNDGTGTTEFGNYDVVVTHAAGASQHVKDANKYYKTGKVVGFMRNLSPYHLLIRALKAAFND